MSSASQYHTRKCMLISVHVTFTLGVCNQLSQEFPMGKEQDFLQNLIIEERLRATGSTSPT